MPWFAIVQYKLLYNFISQWNVVWEDIILKSFHGICNTFLTQFIFIRKFNTLLSILITQGVIRVRKRVTLMAITVSAIFGICWGTNSVVYIMVYFASYSIGEVPVAISDMMVLFNSAVNLFVYALLNQQFREKMKGMVCCTCPSSPRVQPNNEAQCIELAEITHPTHRTGPCSLE